MGRTVRMVPPDWQHPKKPDGSHIPLLDQSFSDAVVEYHSEHLPDWLEGLRLWEQEGKVAAYDGVKTIAEAAADALRSRPYSPPPENPTYEWWAGRRPTMPVKKDYMPDFPEGTATHYMMYEDTSEGTPISPAFATPEELARWLADNEASAFAGETASYEAWLSTIKRGFAHTASFVQGRLVSGVEDLADKSRK